VNKTCEEKCGQDMKARQNPLKRRGAGGQGIKYCSLTGSYENYTLTLNVL
jgi:hypothetical protein